MKLTCKSYCPIHCYTISLFTSLSNLYLGGDATDSFEDVGHSTDARELMQDYYIGDIVEVIITLF